MPALSGLKIQDTGLGVSISCWMAVSQVQLVFGGQEQCNACCRLHMLVLAASVVQWLKHSSLSHHADASG